MAPVRAGLACPVEGRDSWSLLAMPPDDVLLSPTTFRTSRMVLLCTKMTLVRPTAAPGELHMQAADNQRLRQSEKYTVQSPEH